MGDSRRGFSGTSKISSSNSGLEFNIPSSACIASCYPERSVPQRQKKHWGGKKGACEKGPVRGRRKSPLPRQKGPGRWASKGPCDPLADKICRHNPTKGGVHSPHARRRSSWPSLGRGAGETPFTHFGDITYSGFLDKAWPQDKTKGEKEKPSKRSTAPAASRPKKRASEGASELKPHKFQENPKNARGPEWHPEKPPRSRTHRQHGRNRQKRRDTKRKETSKTSACVGVSCDCLIYIS